MKDDCILNPKMDSFKLKRDQKKGQGNTFSSMLAPTMAMVKGTLEQRERQ